MNIQDLKNIASERVAKDNGAAPRVYLDRVRRSLVRLLFTDDQYTAAKAGQPVVFAVPNPEGDLAKAIEGLFCLAANLGVDVAAELEKRNMAPLLDGSFAGTNAAPGETKAAGTANAPANASGDVNHAFTNAQVPAGSGAPAPVAGVAAPAPGTSALAPASNAPANGNDAKIAGYRSAITGIKTMGEANKVLKDFMTDKDLDPKNKAALQNDLKEAKKKLSA